MYNVKIKNVFQFIFDNVEAFKSVTEDSKEFILILGSRVFCFLLKKNCKIF